jgi:hypothetical protein
MRALLAIDPGLQGTGLAFWEDRSKLAPSRVYVIRSKADEDWVLRAEAIAVHLRTSFPPRVGERHLTLACELMEMHGSARARMMWHGDLQRTLVLIGMMTMVMRQHGADRVRLIPPSEWKGQLPKSVVERRIQSTLGRKVCENLEIKTHGWDAVGIGLWVKGKF